MIEKELDENKESETNIQGEMLNKKIPEKNYSQKTANDLVDEEHEPNKDE